MDTSTKNEESEKKKKGERNRSFILPEATTGDPTHDKVMWKSHDEQGGSWLERFPGSARASTPKPESVCLTILCLSPTLLTLTGGYPWSPFSGKGQLRALVNKSPGYDKGGGGRGMVCSRLSLYSPLFHAWVWRCLRLGLAFREVDIPQSGLLAQIISLR